MKKYIDSHLVDFKEEHTKVEFYAGKIVLENLEMIYAVGMLLYRDPESSKQIYQLMIK